LRRRATKYPQKAFLTCLERRTLIKQNENGTFSTPLNAISLSCGYLHRSVSETPLQEGRKEED
ncbi:MAG: hypothetical protein DRI61_14640, partial [Chloroflexi bacterium]